MQQSCGGDACGSPSSQKGGGVGGVGIDNQTSNGGGVRPGTSQSKAILAWEP